MTDRVGQRLGNYRLLRPLGRGGFADVYLGEHVHLDTQAAVKVLHTQVADENIKRFCNEARLIAHLKHPNIVRVLEFGLEDGLPFLVMDYAPNGTLRHRHCKGSQLPLSTIVCYIQQVANALQYAHHEQVIHRDIKPENMLLGLNDEVLLSDFGLAVVFQSTSFLSTLNQAGTLAYMAPEQFQGRVCRASDQYALGVVVYEWLCGDHPFHGSFTELCAQHMFALPPPLHEKVLNISPELEQVVLRALAKDPHDRFESVQAFASALEQASQEVRSPIVVSPNPSIAPSQVSPPEQLPPSVHPSFRRRTLLFGLAGLVATSIVGWRVGLRQHLGRPNSPLSPTPTHTTQKPIICDITVHNEEELKAEVQTLQPGQTLCIVPGTYNMRFDSNARPDDPHAVAIPNGTASKPDRSVPSGPVTIRGYDPATGTNPVPAKRPVIRPQASVLWVLYLEHAHDIVIDSLFLDGGHNQYNIVKLDGEYVKGTETPIPGTGSTNIIIKNSELARSKDSCIYMRNQSNANHFINLSIHDIGSDKNSSGIAIATSHNTVDHCLVYNSTGIGISLSADSSSTYVTHNTIKNCIVHHNGINKNSVKEPGIFVFAPADFPENVANTEIYNNVVYENAYGIWIGGTSHTPGGATDTKVYNNTVFKNGGDVEVPGIYIGLNTTRIDVQNNISYKNDIDYSDNVVLKKNWHEVSPPPFVDITNPNTPNLHLTSHTLPQGAHLDEVTSDADGHCRPSGTYDMGAYEFGPSGQCATWD